MPIRPENKQHYPKDWKDISLQIRERAGHKCEWCGLANYALGGRDEHGVFRHALPEGERLLRLEWPKPNMMAMCDDGQIHRIVRIVLTVAHLDHIPENCKDENLVALCQRCHNRYDASMRQQGIKARRRAMNAIGELI